MDRDFFCNGAQAAVFWVESNDLTHKRPRNKRPIEVVESETIKLKLLLVAS